MDPTFTFHKGPTFNGSNIFSTLCDVTTKHACLQRACPRSRCLCATSSLLPSPSPNNHLSCSWHRPMQATGLNWPFDFLHFDCHRHKCFWVKYRFIALISIEYVAPGPYNKVFSTLQDHQLLLCTRTSLVI